MTLSCPDWTFRSCAEVDVGEGKGNDRRNVYS
jgi:hypothetical protein